MRFLKAYVDLPDGQIHIRDTHPNGEGAPEATPLIMLHQTASSGMMYDRMIPFIEGRRVIAPDTPGFGGSFDPATGPALEDYADWLFQMMDALGIERAHLMGHHTGGCIALVMADARPDRVASLSVIGPVYLTPEEREEYRGHYSTPFSPDWSGDYLSDTFEMVRKLGPGEDLDLQHRETVAALRAWQARFHAYSAVWDNDQAGLWDRVDLPILVSCAQDDVLLDCLYRVYAVRPDAKVAPITGANFEPDRAPEDCAKMLLSFVNALDVHAKEPA